MLLFTDGCDYGATADIVRKFSNNVDATVNTTGGRFGGGAIELPGSGDYIDVTWPWLDTNKDATGAICFAFAFKKASAPVSTAGLLSFSELGETDGDLGDGSSNPREVMITCAASGVLTLREWWRGSNSVSTASTTTNVCDGLWHWIEIAAYPDNTSGIYKVVVDGATEIDLSGDVITDTNPAPPTLTGFNAFRFQGSASGTVSIDDIVVWNNKSSGITGDLTYSNFPLGDSKIETLRPNGIGTDSAFTSTGGDNWTAVDEATVNLADYVSSTTNGNVDTYAFTNLGATPTTVHAVSVNVVAANTDAGPAPSIRGRARRSTSTANGLTQNITGSPRTYQFNFPQDPSTSSAWDETGINAAEFGLENTTV